MWVEGGAELGIEHRVVELKTCADVRKMSPSAYGVFSVIYEGNLLSYHYLLRKDVDRILHEAPAGSPINILEKTG